MVHITAAVLTLDPSLLEDDKEMLEDLIAAAFNDAVRRAEELQKKKMASVTAGMPLPPGMKFRFNRTLVSPCLRGEGVAKRRKGSPKSSVFPVNRGSGK